MNSIGFFKKKDSFVFSPQKLSGLVVPLVTPLNEDKSVDVFSLKILVARMMNKGVKNFFIFNRFSEEEFLSNEQKALVLETVFNEVNGKGLLIVGCFGSSTDEIIAKVSFVEKFSSVCVVNVPFFALERELNFVDFFDSLFTQTKANILVYNNPFLFKASIPALWLDNVINWEKLVGFIDASRNEDYIDELGKYSQLTKLFEENEDFAFVSLRRGFSGLCCLASLLFPSYYTNLIENFSEFDFKKMVRYEARVSALSKLLSPEKKVQAFKYALSLHGLIQPFSFEKYGELSEKERFLIEEEFSPRKVSRKVA